MKQPNMEQIAQQLNLSRMTVSRVLNKGKAMYTVKPATRERIHAYLNKIRYVRNYHALRLSKPKGEILGIYYDGIFTVHHVTTALNRYIQETQVNPRVRIEIKVAPLSKCVETIEELLGRGATKIVWFMEQPYKVFDHAAAFDFLGRTQSVLYNSPLREDVLKSAERYPKTSLIYFDRKQSWKKIAEKLFKLGHRKICIPSIKNSDVAGKENFSIYRDAGLELHFVHPEEVPYLMAEEYEGALAKSVEASIKKFNTTAAVFQDDVVAVNTMIELEKRGVQVPDQISVVGTDGEPWLKYLPKPVETFSFPVVEALHLVQEILSKKKKPGIYPLKLKLAEGKTLIGVNQMKSFSRSA